MATDLDHGPGDGGEHPLVGCVRVIEAALDEVANVDPVFMSTEDKTVVMPALASSIERARGLLLRLLGTAGDVADEAGARTAAAWLGHHTHGTRAAAAADGRLAEALETRYRQLQDSRARPGRSRSSKPG